MSGASNNGNNKKKRTSKTGARTTRMIGIIIGIVNSFTSFINFKMIKNLNPKRNNTIGNFNKRSVTSLKRPKDKIFKITSLIIARVPIEGKSKRDAGLSYIGNLG